MAIVRTATRRFVSRQSSVPGVRSLMAALLSVSVGMTLVQSVLGQGTATPAPSDAIAAPVTPSAGPATPLSPFEDATFGFRSVIPSGWTDRGRGVHTRAGTTSDGSDQTLITLQSAPLAPDAILTSMLPQFALTEPPAPVGTRETAALNWTLHHVDLADPTLPLAVDLAMAHSDGQTWIVSLWTSPAESEDLYQDVFLSVLDAFTPLVTAVASPNPAYESLDVTFPGGAPDVALAGTLTIPRGVGPHPGVVLITGSGAQDRDESIAPLAAIKPFALIADALSSAGIAVLRYDDRGVAHSTGDYLTATVADFTEDAGAAVRYLRARPEIDPERVGVLGHSEGGLAVASLAAADPTLAFVVAAAAPAVPGVDLLVAQAEAIARAAGLPEASVKALGQRQRALLEAAREGLDEEVRSLLATALGESWDQLTPDQKELAGPRDGYIQQSLDGQLAQFRSPEALSIIRSDAGADWKRVTVPVLALYGGKDVQVLADQNAPALEEILSTGASALSRVVVLPDANHLFQPAVIGSPSEYGTLPQEFTAAYLPMLVDWVTARVSSVDASPEP